MLLYSCTVIAVPLLCVHDVYAYPCADSNRVHPFYRSILRAFLCVALGLPPAAFRAGRMIVRCCCVRDLLLCLCCLHPSQPTIVYVVHTLHTHHNAPVDVNNGGVSVFRINKRAEPMLCGLNYTAHMHTDNVEY